MSTHHDFDQVCSLAVANGQALAAKMPVPKMLAWNPHAYDAYCKSQVFAAMDVFIPYLSTPGVLGEQARSDILAQYITNLSAVVPHQLNESQQASVRVLCTTLQNAVSSSNAFSLEARDVLGAWDNEQWVASRQLLEDWTKPLPTPKEPAPISLLDMLPPSPHKEFLQYCHDEGEGIAAARIMGSSDLAGAVNSKFTPFAKELKKSSPEHYKALSETTSGLRTPNPNKLVEASMSGQQVDLFRRVRSELLEVTWTTHRDLLQTFAQERVTAIAHLVVEQAQLACDHAAQVLLEQANQPAQTIAIEQEQADPGPSLLTQYRQRLSSALPHTTSLGPRI